MIQSLVLGAVMMLTSAHEGVSGEVHAPPEYVLPGEPFRSDVVIKNAREDEMRIVAVDVTASYCGKVSRTSRPCTLEANCFPIVKPRVGILPFAVKAGESVILPVLVAPPTLESCDTGPTPVSVELSFSMQSNVGSEDVWAVSTKFEVEVREPWSAIDRSIMEEARGEARKRPRHSAVGIEAEKPESVTSVLDRRIDEVDRAYIRASKGSLQGGGSGAIERCLYDAELEVSHAFCESAYYYHLRMRRVSFLGLAEILWLNEGRLTEAAMADGAGPDDGGTGLYARYCSDVDEGTLKAVLKTSVRGDDAARVMRIPEDAQVHGSTFVALVLDGWRKRLARLPR